MPTYEFSSVPYLPQPSPHLKTTYPRPVSYTHLGKKVDESRYDELFIFLARCFPVIPAIAVNLFCGIIHYDLKKYLIITFLGSAVQILGWGLLAWFSGNVYMILEDKIAYIGNIITVIIILIVIYFIIMKKREMKRKK